MDDTEEVKVLDEGNYISSESNLEKVCDTTRDEKSNSFDICLTPKSHSAVKHPSTPKNHRASSKKSSELDEISSMSLIFKNLWHF